jgi:hypothetical protein
MATYNKYQQFVEDVLQKVHDLFGASGSTADVVKAILSNTAPNAATHVVRADVTELGTANGYTSGGISCAHSTVRSGLTITMTGTNVTWTATGGSIGPFQYVIHYNDTPTGPADPLINWWDYGSALTLLDGETFTVKYNNGAGSGTVFTFA